jgi:phosphoribosyl-ATP pyrophosphohydrolase/phosphoribosyl-AMP cyclohydrolase
MTGETLPLAGLADAVDWDKLGGLVPAVIQDSFDGRVLMLGYMNREALELTLSTGRVTFWSRSREQLWCKGETSGHFLDLASAELDCDADCLLIQARPAGPTCHLGTDSCFDRRHPMRPQLGFLAALERVIAQRDTERPEGSYTSTLFEAGVKRIAQKVGEEGVETALAAAAGEDSELLDEAADLLYHLLVLLRSRELTFEELVQRLESRHG